MRETAYVFFSSGWGSALCLFLISCLYEVGVCLFAFLCVVCVCMCECFSVQALCVGVYACVYDVCVCMCLCVCLCVCVSRESCLTYSADTGTFSHSSC